MRIINKWWFWLIIAIIIITAGILIYFFAPTHSCYLLTYDGSVGGPTGTRELLISNYDYFRGGCPV